MSILKEDNLEINIEDNNKNKNNIFSPTRNNKNNINTENQANKNYSYKGINSPILNIDDHQKYLSPNTKDISSPIYPISNKNNYPYYFKYINSTMGDDFHKTKKYYPSYNKYNQLNPLIDNQNINQISDSINESFNKENEYYNKIPNYNENSKDNDIMREKYKYNYNNWYEKFKKSNIYNDNNIDNDNDRENNYDESIKKIKNSTFNYIPCDKINLCNNNEEIMANNIRKNEKDYFLDSEMNKLSLMLRQINNQINSEDNFLIKNKYAELF